MKFPLPKVNQVEFSYKQYPRDGKRRYHQTWEYYDNGKCCICGRIGQLTCRVQGIPNLCKECYPWMLKYSEMKEDPYRLQKIKDGEEIDVSLVKKAIQYVKVAALDVAGVRNMSTAEIIFNAWMVASKDARETQEETKPQIDVEELERLAAEEAERAEREAILRAQQLEIERQEQESERMAKARQKRLNRISSANPLN